MDTTKLYFIYESGVEYQLEDELSFIRFDEGHVCNIGLLSIKDIDSDDLLF